jgi:hypothetical protein
MSESALPRLTAVFCPERDINGSIYPVDENLGERRWDCTAFVLAFIETAGVNEVTGFRIFFRDADSYSDRDWIARDPTAPAWIHEWEGPFEVEIEGVGEFMEYHGIDLAKIYDDDKVVPLLDILRSIYPLPEPDHTPTPAAVEMMAAYRANQAIAEERAKLERIDRIVDRVREELVETVERIGKDGLRGPRDLDVALDAIACAVRTALEGEL